MATPEEAGIIGPSKAEAAIFNELKGPIRESRESRILAGIAAVLGIPTSLALISACAPQPPAEVRSISTPTATPEVLPTATASPTPEPPTPEPAKVLSTPTTEPTKAPIVEVKNGFDCGILSPEACTKAEYITWGIPGRKLQEGIGVILDAGEKLKLPETMTVAATENARPGDQRIAVVRKDGSQINIHGDITPVGIGRVGKELPAGTVFAQSSGLGLKFLGDYTIVILFTNQKDLEKYFPQQIKKTPRVIEINATPQPQAGSQSATIKGDGLVFLEFNPQNKSFASILFQSN